MPRIRIVHWRADEAGPLVDLCRSGGYEVDYEDMGFPELARAIRSSAPDALVIDLTRAPSHGRELAITIRRTKYSRYIPIIFVDGEPEKVEAVRRMLPDAIFTSRQRLCSRIKTALARPVLNPIAPPTVMERYQTRTVAQKVGIKANSTVALFDAPRDYLRALGQLPEGVEFAEDPDEIHPVTLWFVSDPDIFQAALPRMRMIAGRTKLWIVWQKGAKSGMTQYLVRELANSVGLVDYKICAMGGSFSAMAFARRKAMALGEPIGDS
jgi:CheY-like chemotaxis protein